MVTNNSGDVKKALDLKVILLIGFISLFFYISFMLLKFNSAYDPWVLGDWLINFQDGGFKRRGLSGSFFFLLQDTTGIKLVYLVYFAQLFFYFIFFYSLYKLLSKKQITPEFLLLIFSPLTLLFLFNNTHTIGRKEIIFLTLFTLNALWISQRAYSNNKKFFIIISISIATLFHELVIFYIPYFIILDILNNHDKNLTFKNFKLNSVYFLSAFIPVLLIYFLGTEINNGQSFEILSQRGVNMKEGIFTFNENPLDFIIINKQNYISYIIPVFYGIILIFFNIKKNYTYYIMHLFSISIIFSSPLFLLAIDWGRWLFIHYTLMLVLLASLLDEKSENQVNHFSSLRNNLYYFIFLILNLTLNMSSYSGFGFDSKTTHFLKALINNI